MIKIMCLSGRFQGVERFFIGTQVVVNWNTFQLGEEVSPNELFSGFLCHQDAWKVDYSQATSEEKYVWFLADFMARIYRALTNGFTVRFMEYEWRWKADESALETVLQNIEDTVADSGFNISIDSDDEHGLVIGTYGLEGGYCK